MPKKKFSGLKQHSFIIVNASPCWLIQCKHGWGSSAAYDPHPPWTSGLVQACSHGADTGAEGDVEEHTYIWS